MASRSVTVRCAPATISACISTRGKPLGSSGQTARVRRPCSTSSPGLPKPTGDRYFLRGRRLLSFELSSGAVVVLPDLSRSLIRSPGCRCLKTSWLAPLSETGKSLIVVEQDIKQALAIADRVYCLREGRVALEGRPSDLSREQITKAYFGI